MKGKITFSFIKLAALIIIPVVLFILPGNYFDEKASMCLSVLLFDAECYGCGLTRACMHLIHGNFFEAYSFNVLSFVAFPLLAFQWAKWGLKEWKFLKFHFSGKNAA